MTVTCRDASNLMNDLGFDLEEDKTYKVLEIEVQQGQTFYLIHRTQYFKYLYNSDRFNVYVQMPNEREEETVFNQPIK